MTILITGISSGFGKAMAGLLSAEGHTVYGTVRRPVDAPLPNVRYLIADLRDNASVEAAAAAVLAEQGAVDVLINNAGMGIGGPAEFNSWEDIETQMDTNFMGQVRFTRALLPSMRARKRGKILFFSSIGGRMGLPFQGYYSASKFALEGFCESLRLELRNSGIDIVVIEPGDFSTNFTASRLKAVSEEAKRAYPALSRAVASFENDERNGLSPEYLAKKVSAIVKRRRPRYNYVISTMEQRLSILLKAVLPKRWFASILASYYKL